MQEKIEGWILDKYVLPDQKLMQGDLIRFEDETDPLKKIGIVVTADCDLQQRKHASLVTLVPVIDVKTLLERYLLIEACERQRESIVAYACKICGANNEPDEALKIATLREKWNDRPTGDLTSPDYVALGIALHHIDGIPIGLYKELMEKLGASVKKANSWNEQINRKGDLLILPSAKDLGIHENIVWVRHIWQIQLGKIAMRTSDAQHHPGERVARLDSPYRYRLTQLLSQVFSDIGLPDSNLSFESQIKEVLEK